MKHIVTYFCLICAPIFIINGNLNSKEDFPVLKGPYLGQKPPGITPEIFAPGIISTKNNNEELFCMYMDGNGVSTWGFNIWIVKKTAEGFSNPRLLDPPINSDDYDIYPSVVMGKMNGGETKRKKCKGTGKLFFLLL